MNTYFRFSVTKTASVTMLLCSAVLFFGSSGTAKATRLKAQTTPHQSTILASTNGVLTANSALAEAEQLYQQGLTQYQANEFQAALKNFQQALILYRKANDDSRWGEVYTLHYLGGSYYGLEQYPEAIAITEQALKLAQEIGDRPSEIAALQNLTLVYFAVGRYTESIETAQQSLRIARAIEDRASEIIALDRLGYTHSSLGQYSQAAESYQQSLELARAENNQEKEQSLLRGLDWVEARRLHRRATEQQLGGEESAALASYRQSLSLYQSVGDRVGEARALNDLGMSLYNLGQYQQAAEYYQQALQISQATGDVELENIVLGNIELLDESLNSNPLEAI